MRGRWDGFRVLTALAIVWTLALIAIGAYVRLSNAGLSCPGWPACYGHLVVPTRASAIRQADRLHPGRPLRPAQASKEMFHRYLASGLGLVILLIALLSVSKAHREEQRPRRLPWIILGLVILQAALGMWTVTLELEPLVVVGHLLGAFLIWDCLLVLWARDTGTFCWRAEMRSPWGRRIGLLALGLLVIQIFLGAWTSTHYAWVGCPDFPTCLGHWWPRHLEYGRAFVLWNRLGVDYQGGTLPLRARAAIYFLHRIGALLVFITVVGWAAALWVHCRRASVRWMSTVVAGLTVAQVAIGVSMATVGMPRWLAVSHTFFAALLLGAVSLLVYGLWTPAPSPH
jgi:cytochrome c oxidase assembly protein subunit 15